MQMCADAQLAGDPIFAADERTLAEIYTAFSPRLYRYAYRLLGEAGEAEEIVAETFHRYLVAVRCERGPRRHLSGYLFRIVHNLITDRFRRRPQETLPLGDDLPGDSDPARAGDLHLQQARARALLLRLTPEQRFVITLKYFEGLSNDEIAAALGKNTGTVKSLQHRGLEALRRALIREGWAPEGALA
jgi:RNA polymerase sigma-70 factor (ECF subfamily)